MSAPEAEDSGLLFVYGECGPNVTEDEFNNWYDNEHAPLRLTVPGISSAARYKTTDGKAPSWLALYDAMNPGVLQGEPYKALSAQASGREKSIVSRLATLNRRIYDRFTTVKSPNFSAASLPAKFVLVVGIEPAPEKEEEVNRWYDEEHLDLMSKVPGFIRARRYKLVSHLELAGQANASPTQVLPFPYLTLYDWETDPYTADIAFQAAISTPWSAKVLGELPSSEFRLFALHEGFSKYRREY
ncbi:hypothetical protein LshimejAT787_2000760 [Lyophyllum shimeji]|uniref:Uncharacterized protein n=1 Tax=Lyophyllum shimeji TaxID=47721 RepID=A0A9P3Q0R4_LYOSH|nr:hypothetical protein LshimejAT787_2000760 [Lyophyllum shimeji]